MLSSHAHTLQNPQTSRRCDYFDLSGGSGAPLPCRSTHDEGGRSLRPGHSAQRGGRGGVLRSQPRRQAGGRRGACRRGGAAPGGGGRGGLPAAAQEDAVPGHGGAGPQQPDRLLGEDVRGQVRRPEGDGPVQGDGQQDGAVEEGGWSALSLS